MDSLRHHGFVLLAIVAPLPWLVALEWWCLHG